MFITLVNSIAEATIICLKLTNFFFLVAELNVENKINDDIRVTVLTKYNLLLTQLTIDVNSTQKYINVTDNPVTVHNLGYGSIVNIKVNSTYYEYSILKVNCY